MKEWQDSLIERFDQIPLNDKAARERLIDLLWLARKFEQSLRDAVANGLEAREQLDGLLETKKRGLLGGLF